MPYQRNNKPAKNVYLQFGSDAFKHETKPNEPKAGAYLFVVDNEQIWIPKSQVIFFEQKDGMINITLPDWIVEKNPSLQEHLDPSWIAAGMPD